MRLLARRSRAIDTRAEIFTSARRRDPAAQLWALGAAAAACGAVAAVLALA
jgi:hypothetical protein